MGEDIHIQLWTQFLYHSNVNNSNGKDRKKVGEKNYSRSEVLELLYTLKAILPNLRWKYNGLYCKQIPTGDPNCPKEVKLAKRVKYLIKFKEGVGDGQEPYGMEEGYQNNTEDEEYIVSSGEEQEEEDDDSDDDNIPPIPLGQPSQTTTQPTQQSMEEPTQQSTKEPTQPTQPTQPPLCQPSQPTQEPELNTPTAISVPPRIVVPRSQSRSTSSSSSSQRFVPASRVSPSPTSTPRSKRQYHRNATNNTTTNNTTNGRQEILDFLIANSKQAALELLKAAIVDVATIFLNRLRPNSNSNPNNSNSHPNNSNSNSDPPPANNASNST
eukprot:jgi/Psemu1/36286/gm1.36286_g